MPPHGQKEVVTATIEPAKGDRAWAYRKDDSQWYILKTNKGTFKGVLGFEPNVGDVLQFEGSWKQSEFSGQLEFSFGSAVLSVPEDPRAMLHLAVSWTKGIGEAREAEIWMLYGPDWRDETSLAGVAGLTETTRWNWGDTLKRLDTQQAQAQAVAFLMSKGCTLNMSNAAWKQWETKTVSIVTANPYKLTDLPRYGFSVVDGGIRQNFGISDTDLRRIDAAILYVFGQVTDAGDTVADYEEVRRGTVDFIADASGAFEDRVTAHCARGTLRVIPAETGMMLCKETEYLDEELTWERFEKTKVN